MGRCYEFGTVVGEGCEHAMVVPAAGGRCECATCDVVCTGRFPACASIIDQPGYVPTTAPAWALAVGTTEPATAAVSPAPVDAGPEPVPGTGGASARAAAASADAGDLAELVESVAKQLAEAGVEVATRIDSLADQVAELQRTCERHAAALENVGAGLDAVVKRLDDGRSASLFGFPRRLP